MTKDIAFEVAQTIDATYLPSVSEALEVTAEHLEQQLLPKIEANRFGCLCIDPTILLRYSDLLAGHAILNGFRLCTVLDFPHGNQPLATRIEQLIQAINCGIDEIDIVIPIFTLYGGKTQEAKRDLTLLADIASDPGVGFQQVLVKVIIETGFWDLQQLTQLIKLLNEVPNIGFYKTSTGREPIVPIQDKVQQIKLIKNYTERPIKASGGIRDLNDYMAMESAGATRFGISIDSAIEVISTINEQD